MPDLGAQGVLNKDLKSRRRSWRDENAPAGRVVAPLLVRAPPGNALRYLRHCVGHLAKGPAAVVAAVAGSGDTEWTATIHYKGSFYVQPLWRLDETDRELVEAARVLVQDMGAGVGRPEFLEMVRSLVPPAPSRVVIRFVAFAAVRARHGSDEDVVISRFISGLAAIARTARYQHADRQVHIDVRLCRTEGDLLEALSEPAYMIVVSAHGRNDSAVLQDSTADRQADLSRLPAGGVRCSGILLDACYGLRADTLDAWRRAAGPGTVLLGVEGKSPYSHAPLLLPMILGGVLCPAAAPSATGADLLRRLDAVIKTAAAVWPGDWTRWRAQVL